jgi:hypothetical protein
MSATQPASRIELKEYCLRALGKPVIQINVENDQLEDRLEEGLQMYQEFHGDATIKTYLKHEIAQDDIDNEYVTLTEATIGVIAVFPLDSGSTKNMFDVRYQLYLNDIYDLTKTSIVSYYQVQQHLGVLQEVFSGKPGMRFSRHQNRLYVDVDWSKEFNVGDYLVAECVQIVDPTTYTDIFNDMWLKQYTTELFRKQWGNNLIKYQGTQLPGGTTLDGGRILDEAKSNIEILLQDLEGKYQFPVDFAVG